MKTLKEYLGISTIRVGGLDSIHPIASLGDTPPKGKGSRDSRATGLVANYTTQGVGTIKPMLTANKKEDSKRVPRKPGQKAGSDKHSDLYTDENPKGTIQGLGFTDKAKAKQSVSKIRGSNRTDAHKMQAAIAMSQRAKVASQRAKDPEKKKDLGQAHKVYQKYIDKNKKKD